MPGLEDLYREIILDHYRNPRNNGTLECPPAHRAEGFNPLCGDEVAVYRTAGGQPERIPVSGGFAEVGSNGLIILAEKAGE